MTRKTKTYGWIPDLPDHRDHKYSAPHAVLGTLPSKVDLRKKTPPVLDQGQLGSCTANAISNAFRFCLQVQKAKNTFQPSRLFIYYNERAIEGTVKSDSGAQIRDGIKSVATQGTVSESVWPYDVGKFATKPDAQLYRIAALSQATSYQRITPTIDQIKGCLASGFPFVFGFTVYEGFESEKVAKTGVLSLPGPTERAIGGHAVMAVGYDDKTKTVIVENSWGPDWGKKGFFTMPYAYITNPNLADDFWTIRIVED